MKNHVYMLIIHLSLLAQRHVPLQILFLLKAVVLLSGDQQEVVFCHLRIHKVCLCQANLQVHQGWCINQQDITQEDR